MSRGPANDDTALMNLEDLFSVPLYARIALVVLALALTVALPLYLLVFRPVNRRGSWGLGEIVAVSLLFLLTVPLAGIVLGLVGYDLSLSLVSLSILTIIQNMLFVALSLYVVQVRYGLNARHLGLHLDRWPSKLFLGAAAGACTLPLAVAAERLAVALLGLFIGSARAASQATREHLSDPLLPLIKVLGDATSLPWMLVLLAIIVPLGEEVFFRGFVHGGLRARWGVMTGILVSSLFFAAVHVQLVHSVPIFFLAVLFSFLYERTGSLLPPIVAHTVNNTVAVLALWRGWDL